MTAREDKADSERLARLFFLGMGRGWTRWLE